MNNKKVVYIALGISIIFLGVALFITFKDKFIKKNSAHVTIKCNASETTGDIKEGDTFKCRLGKEYTFTIKSIDNNKIVVKASDKGLSDIVDGKINLEDKKDTFEVTKGNTLDIGLQATDSYERVEIKWE